MYSCSPVRRQRKDCPVGSVKSSRTSDGGAPSGSQLHCNKNFDPHRNFQSVAIKRTDVQRAKRRQTVISSECVNPQAAVQG